MDPIGIVVPIICLLFVLSILVGEFLNAIERYRRERNESSDADVDDNERESHHIDALTVAELHADAVKRAEDRRLAEQEKIKQDKMDLENNLRKTVTAVSKTMKKIIVDGFQKSDENDIFIGICAYDFERLDISIRDFAEDVALCLRRDGFDVNHKFGYGNNSYPCVEIIFQKPSNFKASAVSRHGCNINAMLHIRWDTASEIQKIGKI